MVKRLTQNSRYQALLQRYRRMSDNDRRALWLLVLALALSILYFLIWSPSWSYVKQSQQAYQRALASEAFVSSRLPQLGSTTSRQKNTGSDSLVSLVTQSGRQYGVDIKRYEPTSNQRLRIWMDDVSYNKMISWLSMLTEEKGIVVQEISLERAKESGLVSARLLLSV